MNNTDKTILITGAANGFGAALAQTLISSDTQLILLDSDLTALNAVYDELDAKFPNQVFLYPMDLKGATPEDYQQLAATLAEQFGKLDGLYLNAATLPAFTPIEYFEEVQWYEVMQVNLNANFHLLHHLLPLLKQSQKSDVVAISDAAIDQYPAFYGAYGVAKAGLMQLMNTLAAENRNTSINTWIAHLPPFHSNLRARLFPREDIETLPQPKTLTQQLLSALQQQKVKSEKREPSWLQKL